MDLSLFALGLGAIVAGLVALDIIVAVVKFDAKAHKEEHKEDRLLRRKLDDNRMLLDSANLQLVQNGLPPVVTKEDITSA